MGHPVYAVKHAAMPKYCCSCYRGKTEVKGPNYLASFPPISHPQKDVGISHILRLENCITCPIHTLSPSLSVSIIFLLFQMDGWQVQKSEVEKVSLKKD